MTPRPPDGLGASAQAAWEDLFGPAIAHRGLWSPDGAPENSLAAFEAACAAGYGIELDVRLTADGQAVVFHDHDLSRMAGRPEQVGALDAAVLGGVALAGGSQTVPTLPQVLKQVAGRALILVELKTAFGAVGPLEVAVAAALEGYSGPAAVIGANPWSHAWFAEHQPDQLRGLNNYAGSTPGDGSDSLSEGEQRALKRIERLDVAQPHFLVFSQRACDLPLTAALRAEGLPVVAWTLRSRQEAQALPQWVDNIIFEGFAP